MREARATEATLRAKGVRQSSPTNWLSCECVRLAKMTCAATKQPQGVLLLCCIVLSQGISVSCKFPT